MNTETLLDRLRTKLLEGGILGSFTARNLATGQQISLDPDRVFPAASLVKVPLALATMQRIIDGEIRGSTRVDVSPGRLTIPGPTGLSKFRHPATIAIDDLLYLSVRISDNSATDALLEITPPEHVTWLMRELNLGGIILRHSLGELADTAEARLRPEERYLAHHLAIDGVNRAAGPLLPQLDPARANTGTAEAFTNLLNEIWRPTRIHEAAAQRLRQLMKANVLRHRLAPEFDTDATVWSSKTGTLLNLRHEIGVAQHRNGHTIAVTALTESTTAAANQPAAEELIAHVARQLHNRVRTLQDF
ncbi:serine hydrolase [Arthrobacter methylotrophus]|uniref:Serine hydrolase n=1 Tax=Arthrobacter methylotrophus TaxID=121291 RepID=A0ABV5UJ62_9MICC